jgi:hypothetical protein
VWSPSTKGITKAFNGTTDRLDATNNFDFTNSAITIISTCFLNAYTSRLFVAHNATNTGTGVYLEVLSTGKMEFVRAGATAKYRDSNTVVGNGQWLHLCVTDTNNIGDSTTINLYRNGILDNSASRQNGATLNVATGKWSIGGLYYADSRCVNGLIANLMLFNRALSAAEVQYLYANPYDMVEGYNLGRFWSIATSGIVYPGTLVGDSALIGDGMLLGGLVS